MPEPAIATAPAPDKSAATPPPSTIAPPKTAEAARNDAFAEIDALENAPPPPKRGEQRKEVQKPIEKAAAIPEEKKALEKPAEDLEKPIEGEPKPIQGKAAELRTAYENLKKEHKALKAEVESKKNAAPQDDPEKPKLLETINDLKKKRDELETELKYLAYEKSDEFKEKYQKPYEETAQNATSRAIQLKVPNEDGTSRNLTEDEFWGMVKIGNDDDALSAAEQLFGAGSTRASTIMERRNEILSAFRRGEQAKSEFRKTGSEREKTMLAERLQKEQQTESQRTQISETFKKLNNDAIEKYPHFFKPEDGDDKGNELLEKGFDFADAAFSGVVKNKETGETRQLTPQEAVKYHSAIRNKAAGFDRLAYKNKALAEKVAELETALKEYQESEPGAGATGRKPEGKVLTYEEEIDALETQGAGRRR